VTIQHDPVVHLSTAACRSLLVLKSKVTTQVAAPKRAAT